MKVYQIETVLSLDSAHCQTHISNCRTGVDRFEYQALCCCKSAEIHLRHWLFQKFPPDNRNQSLLCVENTLSFLFEMSRNLGASSVVRALRNTEFFFFLSFFPLFISKQRQRAIKKKTAISLFSYDFFWRLLPYDPNCPDLKCLVQGTEVSYRQCSSL